MKVKLYLIPGYSNYYITITGNVYSKRKNGYKKLKNMLGKRGYFVINLKQQLIFVHKLVLMTFIGPRPDGMECRHLDGNKLNNNLSNLVWGTSKENHADRKLHGTNNIHVGSKNPNAILNEEAVKLIKKDLAKNYLCTYIAKKFNVRPHVIQRIKNNHTWKHVKV